MKGLASVPSKKDLLSAANIAQTRPLTDEEIALFSQWARFDPRFAEILVANLALNWTGISLGRVTSALMNQPWPTVLIVLLRFSEWLVAKNERKAFRIFLTAVEALLKPARKEVPPQLFFIPLQRPSTVITHDEVNLRSSPYSAGGFIGSQPLLSRAKPPSEQTLLAPDVRRLILRQLLANRAVISMEEYRAACKGLVSVRQAQRDLRELAHARGHTRNRRYLAKSFPKRDPADFLITGLKAGEKTPKR